ncbi:MAG: tRNA pseudouridine(55) synthase TruB [Termitinemataceae bacterium]|nr:MAG: tRNA pseudouridine(55) synthase TruB [Termitinemataceae bacterium]
MCILLNKQSGFTSFDALYPIKRAIKSGKAGHTGTLDKFASGLLIVLTGSSLKLSDLFMHCDKHYTATIKFGVRTGTLDPEGDVVEELPPPSLHDVEAALPHFLGDIMQIPPAYSALHINGKRASDIARSGGIVEIKPRQITIYDIKLCDWHPPFAKITVHCSCGTYIRSLARDIAAKTGSCAHLSALIRNKVGGFSLDDAVLIGKDSPADEVLEAMQPIKPATFDKIGVPHIEIDEKTAAAVKNGVPLGKLPELRRMANGTKTALFCNDQLVAVRNLSNCYP